MLWLVMGLALFLGVHSVSIVSPQGRNRLVRRWGVMGWQGLYSAVSLAGLVLIVWGYSQARQAPVWLYAPPDGLRHLTALLMLPVFVLLLAPYFPGRIKALVRHPMLLAVKLWALAHLLTNGTLADALLFGSFLVWAVLDRMSVKRREVAGQLRQPPALPASRWNDAVAVFGGLTLYGIFALWAHGWLIGVRPFGPG